MAEADSNYTSIPVSNGWRKEPLGQVQPGHSNGERGTSDVVRVRDDGPVVISVVLPVFNEQLVLVDTVGRLKTTLNGMGLDYEIVFVDDGSLDGSSEMLDALSDLESGVKIVHLSRNFGHQIAISAGLDHAGGDVVVVMDADLQDPPELIPSLLQAWRSGYDVVHARRSERRGDSWFKRRSAALFYRILRRMTDVDIPLDAGDFRLLDRRVADVLKGTSERNPYVRGLVAWSGFSQTSVDYVRDARAAGVTKYSLRKMVKLAMDAITSFSSVPVQWMLYAGALLTVIGLLALLACTILSLTVGRVSASEYLLCADAMLAGCMVLAVGIVGQYVSRVLDEVRGRPLYVVRNRVGFTDDGVRRHE